MTSETVSHVTTPNDLYRSSHAKYIQSMHSYSLLCTINHSDYNSSWLG